jgi:hypothetical protein
MRFAERPLECFLAVVDEDAATAPAGGSRAPDAANPRPAVWAPMAANFFAEEKRVPNAKAKRLHGFSLAYSTGPEGARGGGGGARHLETGRGSRGPAQAYEPEVPVEVREWIGVAALCTMPRRKRGRPEHVARDEEA